MRWLAIALWSACGDDVAPSEHDAGRGSMDSGTMTRGDTGARADAAPIATGEGCPSALPEGWLFCEDFERGSFDGFSEHEEDPARLRIEDDASNARSGTHAMYVPAESSAGNQGGEATWRSWPTGYDTLHLRAWVKLASDFESLHHFLHIGGAREDDRWSADGLAGCRPTGENFFSLTLDLVRDDAPSPGKALLYTYWPDMTCDSGESCARYADPVAICDHCASRGAPCASGPECCWGNHLEPSSAVVPPLGEWVCYEFSTHINAVGSSDGWVAFSIDGVERHREDGMRIRTDEVLELNSARVGIYNTSEDAGGHANRGWFDDVVIATVPIGCD
jgi:hypothetical protein